MAGYQAWEFYKRMNHHKFMPPEDSWFMSGDYETATDFIEHEVAYKGCTEYLEGASILGNYAKSWLSILCSSRLIDGKFVTRRGILMGEPGSKIVLTILTRSTFQMWRSSVGENAVADLEGYPFASAGDD
jgi:hypothetical protein